MQSPWRQLPDGTWFNDAANVVSAPRTDAPATRRWKTQPSPAAGPGGMLVTPPTMHPAVRAAAQPLDGYYGGRWPLHMRQGRNYAALGQDPAAGAAGRKLIGIVVVIGVAGAIAWFQCRKKTAAGD